MKHAIANLTHFCHIVVDFLQNYFQVFLKILKKITETGTCNKVYLGYHSNLPKDGKSTNSKRDEFHEYLENVEDSLESVFEFKQKYGEFPWKIEYFIPQDRKNGEDMKYRPTPLHQSTSKGKNTTPEC